MLKNVEFDLQSVLGRLEHESQTIESDILEKTSRRHRYSQVAREVEYSPPASAVPRGDLSLTFPPKDETLVQQNIYGTFENHVFKLNELLGEEASLSDKCIRAVGWI